MTESEVTPQLGSKSAVFPTNAQILERLEKCSSAAELQKNLAADFPDCGIDQVDTFVLQTKAIRLSDKCKKLIRNKQTFELENVKSELFSLPEKKLAKFSETLPATVSNQFNKITKHTAQVISMNRELKRDLEQTENENENLAYQIQHTERKVSILENLLEITNDKYKQALTYKKDYYELQEDLRNWELKYESLSKEFEETVDELHEKKQKLKLQSTRNLNKKIKRRDEVINNKNEVVREKESLLAQSESEISLLKNENERMINQVKDLKTEKKNLLQKINRLRKSKHSIIENNLHEILSLKLEISEKDNKVKQLEEINALLSEPIIESFYEGRYSDEIRETIMALVTECGVSQLKVNEVMQVVIKNLTGKTLSKLPSTGVKSRLLLEAKRVANQQIAQTLLDKDLTFTLHQDGTSKFHRHFQSFQVTGSNCKTFSLGMPEVSCGNSKTLFESFLTLLDDLTDTIEHGEKRVNLAKIINSMIATMSDQGSVNPVFNDNFQKFRQDLLPKVYEHWESICLDDKKKLGELFSFFCKMHIFVNIASESDKCISQFENMIIAEGRNPHAFNSSESGTARLVRTVSKAFTTHGCEKAGVGGHFQTYLKEKGIKNHLLTFRGHRFNHLFHAAACTYYHLNDIREFLDKWADPNDLLKSISFDAKECIYISGVRALGLIDKIVTGPLWRIIETVPNSLSLNTHLYQLKLTLDRWCKDASPLMEGECVFDDSVVKITKDCVYDSLISPADNPLIDTYTQMFLEICFGAMLLILERQAKDQFPGGKYWSLDSETYQKLEHVPTTNTVSERDFAQLDVLMRLKPSASTYTYESIVMWSNNKTSSWLHSLSDDVRKSVLADARKNAPHMLLKMRKRQEILYQSKLELLRQRQEKKTQLAVKQHTNKVRLTQKIQEYGGIWAVINDIDNYKKQCNNPNELKEAIVSQLQFRKTVLNSSGPKHLFQQQHQGRQFSVEELENNLRQVITLNIDKNENVDSQSDPSLKYKESENLQSDLLSFKQSLSKKIEENRAKVQISQQKNLLPAYLSDPQLLVGKKIKHKCRDPETKVVQWFEAVVEDVFSTHENVLKTEFYVCYDDDSESIWHFPLLKDMQNGDIIIL